VFDLGIAHFGFSSQHHRDFTFASGLSQTCYLLLKQSESPDDLRDLARQPEPAEIGSFQIPKAAATPFVCQANPTSEKER
jgi:hypothetical protein